MIGYKEMKKATENIESREEDRRSRGEKTGRKDTDR